MTVLLGEDGAVLASLALWLAQALAIEIVGEGQCPSPAAVRSELEALSPSTAAGASASAGSAAVDLGRDRPCG